MRALPERVARIRITPLGWVLVALVAVCSVLAIVASGGAQTAALVGAVLLVLVLVGAPRRASNDRVEQKLQAA